MKFTIRLIATTAALVFSTVDATDSIVPDKKIDLLADPDFSDFTFYINEKRSLTNKREEVWKLRDDGILHISGKAWGYLRTKQAYRDYYLLLDYTWGKTTYAPRENRARDGGLMVHGYGPDGAFGGIFLSSFQAQLLEGASGDLIALAARDKNKVPAPTKMSARVVPDRDGEPAWNPKGKLQHFPKKNSIAGRLNWRDRDPDWTDAKGYRGANDIEKPPGQWNRLEVICRGDTIQICINGELVNEASDVSPSHGYVCMQSEAAEWMVRRWEILPIDQFEGKSTKKKEAQ